MAELAVSLADKCAFPASSSIVGSLNFGLEKPLSLNEPLEKADRNILDYLLVSNRLKGFDWGRIMAIDPSKNPTTRMGAIRISGMVVNEKNFPVSNALVSLTSSSLQQFNASTDQRGEFVINLPVSVEKRDVSVSATDSSGKGNFRVILNKSFKDELVNSLDNISVNEWHQLEQIYRANYFKDNPDYFKIRVPVKVKGSDKKNHEPYWKNYLNGSSTLLDILKSIRPYQLSGNKIIFRGINSILAQDGALIVIDGQRVGTDASSLSIVNPLDVEDIRVMVDPVEMGEYSGLNSVGVIEIKTKRGSSGTGKSEEMTDRPKEDSSKLFTPDPIGDAKYNLITTLQWNPVISTNEKGEATINFKTGGIRSTFILEIAGFTNQRQWIGSKTEIRVE